MADTPDIEGGDNSYTVAADQIKAFIERIERLEEEKASIAGDIKEVYAEAKANGFDRTVLREIVAIRKRDHDEMREQHALLRLHQDALGMGGVIGGRRVEARAATGVSQRRSPGGKGKLRPAALLWNRPEAVDGPGGGA